MRVRIDPKYHCVLRFVNISFKEIIYDNSKTIDMAGYISRIIDISIYIQCTSRLHPGRGTQICYDQSPRGGFLIIITITIIIIIIVIIIIIIVIIIIIAVPCPCYLGAETGYRMATPYMLL